MLLSNPWYLEWLVNNIVDFLGTDVAHSIYAIFGTYLILVSAGNFTMPRSGLSAAL